MKIALKYAPFVAAVTAAALALSACSSSSNPLETTSNPAAGGGTSVAGSDTAGSATGAASSDADGSTGAGSASGSSGAGAAGGPIIVGSADFTENVIIAEIYAAALKAKGIDATTKPRLGSREVYIPALKDGSINLVPEYTGTALQYFDKKATASDPETTFADLKKALPANLTILDKAPAEDKDSLTVTKATADKEGLKTIEDLKGKSQNMVLGGPEEWKTRMTGVPGFQKYYGLTFKSFEVTDAGGPITVKALTTGIIQAGNIFTTDAAIAKNNLVALEDTKGMFGAQNVVPLIAKSAVTPQVTDALNAVSAKLTTEDLVTLNDKVANQHLDPATVAQDWVSEKGLG
ncbi:ABC transporter substrate-binding protein [Nakamurella lactea]|uniref:ABC transporter substrate-binding protein n=1 Tax=Nakamurella lactea TaxID=459515 RepID=UPI000685574C|nr:ABC transporter substrate-binding protein [Nakamurella lactea]